MEARDGSLEELKKEEDLKGLRQVLEKLMWRDLTLRQRVALKLRFGFYGREYTLEEIGKMISVSKERARQLEAEALYKLRSFCKSRKLEVFLEE